MRGGSVCIGRARHCCWPRISPAGRQRAAWLNVLQLLHVVALRRSLRAFDVQVRLARLQLRVADTAKALWPIPVLQLIGMKALLVADPGPLARLLVLLRTARAAVGRIAALAGVLPAGARRHRGAAARGGTRRCASAGPAATRAPAAPWHRRQRACC